MRIARRYLLLALLIGLMPLLGACGLANRDASPTRPSNGAPAQANPGEREGAIPASGSFQAPPQAPAPSAAVAIERFAALYINWTYLSLRAHEARLAASAVGEARTTEEQAQAQSAHDTPLQRAHIYNSGTVLSVSHAIGGGAGEWVIVTREQTGGDQEYAGLQAALHVTLATVQAVPGGWAVAAWRPQS
jgi:hypothetical protein